MSSAVISTTAALRRPFLFDADVDAEPEAGLDVAHVAFSTLRKSRRVGQPLDWTAEDGSPTLQSKINNQQSIISSFGNRKSAIENFLLPASRLEIRPAPEMASTGISELDALSGGLPRGCLTEICGPASSGRTTVLLAALAAATRRGEYCALIDTGDALDPHFAGASGIELDHLLWVRCGEHVKSRNAGVPPAVAGASPPRTSEPRLEQLLRATDLLLESGGFGLIALDLADVPAQAARRIPLTTWFRFRRAVEHKSTILLTIEQQPIAGSCSSLLLQLGILSSQLSVLSSKQNSVDRTSSLDVNPSHTQLLTELKIHAELIRSRLERKPARSVAFETKTAWAG